MKSRLQIGAVLGALSLGWSSTALGHAAVADGHAVADQNQVLTLSVGHGCAGADTFRVEVQIPDGIDSVRGLPNTFGEADVQTDDTGAPVAVVWTKDTVRDQDDQYYLFQIRVPVPDAPFTRLYFPTIQTCRDADGEETETAWDVITEGGHGHGDEENPAPSVMILPARAPGWNKWTVDEEIHDLSVFDDAAIVWAGDAAYSSNPETMRLIEADDDVEVLEHIEADTEIWVKY